MFDWCNYWLNCTRGIRIRVGKNLQHVRKTGNPPLLCKDGYSVSIQGNSTAYCWPREDNCKKYEHVELGYPNQLDKLIMEYAEDTSIPTKTVYGYVPVTVVNKLIDKHGGFDKKKIFLDKLANLLSITTYGYSS